MQFVSYDDVSPAAFWMCMISNAAWCKSWPKGASNMLGCKQHAMHLVVVSMPVSVNEAVNYVHSHSIIQAMTSIVASAHRHSFGS